MREHGEILIHECDNSLPHDAHDWRWGFLWRHKGSCLGITQSQYNTLLEFKWPTPKIVPVHIHRLEYKPSQKHIWVNPDRYVWVCKDQRCNVIFSAEKEEFRGALLHEGRAVAKRLPPRRRSWRSN